MRSNRARTGRSLPGCSASTSAGRSQAELAAELAAELGTTRESLNRALRGFAELGLMTVEGDRVTLADPAGLSLYAG